MAGRNVIRDHVSRQAVTMAQAWPARLLLTIAGRLSNGKPKILVVISKTVKLVFPALFVALFLASAVGQTFTGSLQVQVTDPSGALIPGAGIAVRNLATGVSYELRTGNNGTSRLDGLDAGHYRVIITATGFQTSEFQVAVRVAEVNSVSWKMVVGCDVVSVE